MPDQNDFNDMQTSDVSQEGMRPETADFLDNLSGIGTGAFLDMRQADTPEFRDWRNSNFTSDGSGNYVSREGQPYTSGELRQIHGVLSEQAGNPLVSQLFDGPKSPLADYMTWRNQNYYNDTGGGWEDEDGNLYSEPALQQMFAAKSIARPGEADDDSDQAMPGPTGVGQQEGIKAGGQSSSFADSLKRTADYMQWRDQNFRKRADGTWEGPDARVYTDADSLQRAADYTQWRDQNFRQRADGSWEGPDARIYTDKALQGLYSRDRQGEKYLTSDEQGRAGAVAYSEMTRGSVPEHEAIISVIVNRARSGDRHYVNAGQDVNVDNVIDAKNQFQGVGGGNYKAYDTVTDQGSQNARTCGREYSAKWPHDPGNRLYRYWRQAADARRRREDRIAYGSDRPSRECFPLRTTSSQTVRCNMESRLQAKQLCWRLEREFMSSSGRGIAVFLVCWSMITPPFCPSQTGERGVSSVVLCGERTAFGALPGSIRPEGISSISLPANQTLWKAMTDKIADVGPVVAEDAVAIITDSFNTVYAFSGKTGRQLWRKEKWTSNIGSDGKYFYILRNAYWDLQALDPGSGRVVWSLRLPGSWLGHYPNLLGVHRGLLFTGQAVVDLEERKVIHAWTSRWPAVSSASVSKTGEIVIGNSEGEITIYDRTFKRLQKMHVDGGEVVEALATSKGITAVAYRESESNNRGVLTFLTGKGVKVWQATWSSGASFPALPPQPFVLAGDDVVVIESAGRKGNLRLTSRKLSNGEVSWFSKGGLFNGPPVACDNTVYVEDIDQIRSFGLQSGIEKTRGSK